MCAFAMLSSLCFEQVNSPNYPMVTLPLFWRFGSTWKLGLDLHAAAEEDRDPLFAPDEPTARVVLRRRKRQQKRGTSRRKSTPPSGGGIQEELALALPTALGQPLTLKGAQLSSYARLFSRQPGFPTTAAERYERMPSIPPLPLPPPSHRSLESEHKLLAQLQKLFRSRYAKLKEIPSLCEASEDDTTGAGQADEEETRTVVTYISLTDQNPQAESKGCHLLEGKLKQGSEGVRAGGKCVLANTKGVRLRIPARHEEQQQHIRWKDLALEARVAEGSVRQMLVSPSLPTTCVGDQKRGIEGSKRCISSDLTNKHHKAHLGSARRSNFTCPAELNSQLTTTPREDRHRMQIQQIKRLIASQRRCHKWFFTLYEFDKPENAEETAKLESSLFDIIINRLHWIYALSVSDLFIPSGRETGPTMEAHSSPHDNTILTKFAVTPQQVDQRLRFKVRRLSRRSLGNHTNHATQELDRQCHLNRHHHHCSTGGESRKRSDPACNLFSYSLLRNQLSSSGNHSLERVSHDDPLLVSPTPLASPLPLSTGTTCVHYAMFSLLSPHNPGQLIDGGVARRAGGGGASIANKVYCLDCDRNMIGGSSIVGSSDLGGSSRRRLKCSSSEDRLICTSRSAARAQALATAETTICYAMSRSVEFCSTLRQLRSEKTGQFAGRMTQSISCNSPTGCLLDPRCWPHHKAKPADHEAMRAQANKHPRKRPRQCHRDRRPTSNMPCPSTRDQKPPGGGGGGQEEQSTFPPDLETKRRIRSRKLRHWLHKRLGQRRVEDWLNTSWTTDETMLSVE
uniref:Uncharacterized protein n=3 Tax=Schistocephalus solidus TaxID=70667 RepID=A0A0V0JB27_SCHSO